MAVVARGGSGASILVAAAHAPLTTALCATASALATTLLLRRGAAAVMVPPSTTGCEKHPAETSTASKAAATASARRKTAGNFEVYVVESTARASNTTPAPVPSPSQDSLEEGMCDQTGAVQRSLFEETVPKGAAPGTPMSMAVREWTTSIEIMASYIQKLELENGELISAGMLRAALMLRLRSWTSSCGQQCRRERCR